MPTFFQWIANNWETVCYWAGGLYAMYKIGSMVTAVATFLYSVVSRFKNAETTLNLLATNHLPHIQAELERVSGAQSRTNDILSEIKEDLRLVLFENRREHE